MPEYVSSEISQAAFDTLLYSDIFDFPLTASEAYKYLSGSVATFGDVCKALNSEPRVMQKRGYYCLVERAEIVWLREQRELRSKKLLPYALAYGRIIGALPFVRLVALTGSLAVHNISTNEDFDYMLVTEPGRLWTARAFVMLLGRLTRLWGHTICPNVIVTENCLEWSRHDLYSARELCQMIPISGMDMHQRLMAANSWVKGFLPNAYQEIIRSPLKEGRLENTKVYQRIFEFLLGGHLGARFESWEMLRKIERFSRQAGFGEETIFTADLCQGNFDHHRKWTQQVLDGRYGTLASTPVNGMDRGRKGI